MWSTRKRNARHSSAEVAPPGTSSTNSPEMVVEPGRTSSHGVQGSLPKLSCKVRTRCGVPSVSFDDTAADKHVQRTGFRPFSLQSCWCLRTWFDIWVNPFPREKTQILGLVAVCTQAHDSPFCVEVNIPGRVVCFHGCKFTVVSRRPESRQMWGCIFPEKLIVA